MTQEQELAIANEAKLSADMLMDRGAWLCHKAEGRTPCQFYLQVGALMRTGDPFEQAYQTCGGIIIWPMVDLSAEHSRSA